MYLAREKKQTATTKTPQCKDLRLDEKKNSQQKRHRRKHNLLLILQCHIIVPGKHNYQYSSNLRGEENKDNMKLTNTDFKR